MNVLAWGHDGPGPWILLFPLIWAAVIVGVVALLRRTVWRGNATWHRADADSPVAVLGRRFASGEVDEEEYRRRLAVLDERFGAGRKEGPA